MPAYEQLPTATEAEFSKLLSQELAALIEANGDVQSLALSSATGQLKQIEIPVNVILMIVNILAEFGKGNAVKLIPIPAELTTQEAAELLNVSRPTLIKLLDKGELPFHKFGNHRKVCFNDLKRYQHQLEAQRLQALDELVQLDQELEFITNKDTDKFTP